MPAAGRRGPRNLDAGAFLERHYRACLTAVCALGLTLTLAFAWPSIIAFRFGDPDDIVRLLEVRDWLNGQNWFDVTQYRLNPPSGYAMHWSRWVDLPVGAIILALRPWIGERSAEIFSCAAVPLAILTLVAWLTSMIARRLFGSGTALLAAFFCFFNASTFSAIWPMRIDHHGWEAAAGLAIVFFLIRRRDTASAGLAGLWAACWMHVSLEGIAFTAGTAGWLGVRWLIAPESERHRLPAFLGTLAIASLLLFLTTHRAILLGQTFCDAVSAVHMAVFAAAALLTGILIRSRPQSPVLRAIGLAVAAIACAALYTAWAPQCTKGPFATLPPLAYRIWYQNVPEGLPLWKNGLPVAAFWMIGPLLGLLGCALSIRSADDSAARARLIDYCGLLAVATAVGLLVLRACMFANLLALPGQAALILTMIKWFEPWPVAIRIVARATALLLLSPMGSQLALDSLPHGQVVAKRVQHASEQCSRIDNFDALNRLPPAIFMTPLDLAPALVAGSHHQAVGSGYHRNGAAIEDVLRFFGSSDANAHAIVQRHGVRYLAYCDGDNLVSFMGRVYPGSLATHLRQGAPPAWLHPVEAAGTTGLRLYAVAP